MIQMFHLWKGIPLLKRKSKTGIIQKSFDTGYDSLFQLYEEWKSKSILDGHYYLLGSSYFKSFLDGSYPPELIEDFIVKRALRLDEAEPKIPLEIGEMLEKYGRSPTMRLGIHRSDSVIASDVLQDSVLHQIMREGLINNGAAMQGLVTSHPPYPNQTLRPADDMISACAMLKSSFRGSKGSILVQLPKNIVNVSFDFERGADEGAIYEKRNGIYYIKPEFIIGYIETHDGKCIFHSREELLENYKGKEI